MMRQKSSVLSKKSSKTCKVLDIKLDFNIRGKVAQKERLMATMSCCNKKTSILMRTREIKSILELRLSKAPREEVYFIPERVLRSDAVICPNWQPTEASSIPAEIKENRDYQNGILIKVAEKKVKFYHLGKKMALSTAIPYQSAIMVFLIAKNQVLS